VRVLQRLVAHAQPRGGAGREVLHQHVGARHQALHHGQRGRLLQVEREALLAAVRPDEVRAEAACAAVVAARLVAAAGAFDLDHARAQVGQLPGAERRRDDVLEREHGDAFERSHRRRFRTSAAGPAGAPPRS
jgi:hypothetical protein